MNKQKIEEYLLAAGWKRWVDYGGQLHYGSQDGDLDVLLTGRNGGWWELGRFTDSDIGNVAVGRYQYFVDGNSLEDLIRAIHGDPESD